MLKAASTVRSPSAVPTTPRPNDIGALNTLDPRLVPKTIKQRGGRGASFNLQKGNS
jgi:hypothetical protein